jgi:protein gp37
MRVAAINRILKIAVLSPHIGLVLTKYPKVMAKYFLQKPAWWRKKFILIFSAGNQPWWDVRWEIMRPLAEQGWKVGTSIAPMLTRVVVRPDFLRLARWCIVGGEQAPGKRPMNPDDARALRDQCDGASLPIFIKQMTRGWRPPHASTCKLSGQPLVNRLNHVAQKHAAREVGGDQRRYS